MRIMNPVGRLFASLLAIAIGFTLNSALIAHQPTRNLVHFLQVAEELQSRLRVPGAGIGIVIEGDMAFLGGIGYRNVEEQSPVEADTLFAIGSNTKAFTGLLVTKLVAQGKLRWDVPIASYIPDFKLSDPYVSQHVTLADACSHMTGIARQDRLWKGKSIDRQEVFQQVRDLPFDFSLREQFSYNNHMYVVVGKAIENVTGQSWEDNIRATIFEPLDMRESFVTYDEFMQYPKKSTGYEVDGTTAVPHLDVDNIGPAGSITSTPRDMMKWMKAWLGTDAARHNQPPFLSEDEIRDYKRPRSASMAGPNEFKSYWAGWGEKITNGEVQLIHAGGIDGQSARIHIRPSDGFGIFVLTNQRSDFKELIIDYAQQFFLQNNLARDWQREAELAVSSDLACFAMALRGGNMATAKSLCKSLPLKSLEPELNQLGYEMLASNQWDQAVWLFELNTERHPESSNAWDSLGECQFEMQNYAEAIHSFEKALELDSNNKNAVRMISRIKQLIP